jgi:hypothetical protein
MVDLDLKNFKASSVNAVLAIIDSTSCRVSTMPLAVNNNINSTQYSMPIMSFLTLACGAPSIYFTVGHSNIRQVILCTRSFWQLTVNLKTWNELLASRDARLEIKNEKKNEPLYVMCSFFGLLSNTNATLGF